jgi:hypothetical protein
MKRQLKVPQKEKRKQTGKANRTWLKTRHKLRQKLLR